MAFDAYQAERIRTILKSSKIAFEEKRMMGGWCVMVDNKMLCGLLQNKENGEDLLMARIGQENHEQFMTEPGASPMNFTGRSMKGFLFVGGDAIDRDSDLEKWIKRCLAFNPLAKASKKKKNINYSRLNS